MKKTIKVINSKGQRVEKEISHIPIRYIIAILISMLETILVIGGVVVLTIYIPYFYSLVVLTQTIVVISIIASNDNPDYKIPWILFVIVLPIIGFMLYFMFYRRKLSKRFIRRIKYTYDQYKQDDRKIMEELKKEDIMIYNQANQLKKIAYTYVYNKSKTKYYKLGIDLYEDMLVELKKAKDFIFIQFFIIEEGMFWNSILDILKEKVKEGVDVKVLYDDIGCMNTLPGNYYKKLSKMNIDASPFGFLRGQADSEINNRNHRKILVIDGKVGYTGGINIADEYINKKSRFGFWKDTGIKLTGDSVDELTKLFLIDYSLCGRFKDEDYHKYFVKSKNEFDGYVIPFGDGPNPIYPRQVSKTMIMNMLYNAKKYVYITTPYLIIDNELAMAIENTAIRGIDIRIVVPHIPDKKIIFGMTKSFYKRFIDAGVRIYEYEPGFIHAKNYISDDEVGIIGTINLDYRSLVHHYENGVWMYKSSALIEMKKDILDIFNISIEITKESIRNTLTQRIIRSIVKIFSPLL